MAETSWPTTAGSRVVTDDQYEHLAWGWARADGILGYPGDTTVAFGDSSGRQVKIRLGKRGFVRGRGWYSGTSDNTLAIAANVSGSTRKDIVVLRLTRSTWAVTAAIVQGTPGAGNPTLTQNATGGTTGVWEIPLAVVTVVNGAATIAAGDVQDSTWYSHGDQLVLNAVTPIQPDPAQYTSMRHFDTGILGESTSGIWRRGPWQTAWGRIGGQRYNSNAALATGIAGTEALANMSSGSVSLYQNRRYALVSKFRLQTTASDTYFIMRIRETNISGTIVGYAEQTLRASGANHNFEWINDFTNVSATTKTYVATIQRSTGGNISAFAGTSFTPVGIWVDDLGPSSPDPVTVVP